jgi:hypothetical protein
MHTRHRGSIRNKHRKASPSKRVRKPSLTMESFIGPKTIGKGVFVGPNDKRGSRDKTRPRRRDTEAQSDRHTNGGHPFSDTPAAHFSDVCRRLSAFSPTCDGIPGLQRGHMVLPDLATARDDHSCPRGLVFAELIWSQDPFSVTCRHVTGDCREARYLFANKARTIPCCRSKNALSATRRRARKAG